jgi:hypothetical protein
MRSLIGRGMLPTDTPSLFGSILLLSEVSEMRKSALPLPILLDEHICCPPLRGEALSAEFPLGCSQRRDNGSIGAVEANSDVVGLHRFVSQGA